MQLLSLNLFKPRAPPFRAPRTASAALRRMRPSSSSMGLAAGSSAANGPGKAAVPPPARQQRSQWPSTGTFILASVGSAIGFGNIWRFPMMLYTRGGGAFMLPYLIALFLAAIPMVVLEFALGQRLQRGHVAMIAHIAPRWVGIGWASVIGTFLLAQFYSVLLAYVLVYLAGSGLSPQPWAAPASLYNASSTGGDTVFTSSYTLGGINATSAGLSAGAAEAAAHRARMRESSRMARLFWEASVLHMSASIDETGGVVGTLVSCAAPRPQPAAAPCAAGPVQSATCDSTVPNTCCTATSRRQDARHGSPNPPLSPPASPPERRWPISHPP